MRSKCFLGSFNYRVDYERGARRRLGFFADSRLFGRPTARLFAGSECSEQTTAVAKSSLRTYQMTLGGLGVPRPMCTLFFCDRSSISEEAWEEMKQNKCSVRDM